MLMIVAINRLTALLSKRSYPHSSFRLSCSTSLLSPRELFLVSDVRGVTAFNTSSVTRRALPFRTGTSPKPVDFTVPGWIRTWKWDIFFSVMCAWPHSEDKEASLLREENTYP